jgi:hypothetical protein
VAKQIAMSGKSLKHMKQWYPAIAIASGISVLLAGGWILFSHSLSNSSLQEPALDSVTLPSPEVTQPAVIAEASPLPSVLPSPKPVSPSQKQAPENYPTTAVKPSPATDLSTSTSEGILRVSNATGYPVRVALLLKKKTTTDAYELPAHWDFEPGEGGDRGLLLSLPNRTLRLSKGDVLVAFAQDGSRRYWGPYVVGETTLPTWNTTNQEWQLTLQP